MIDQVQSVLSQKSIQYHINQGVLICKTGHVNQGLRIAQDLLYELSDRQTVLFLSGGRTPKDLYVSLAEDEMLAAFAIALVDERFGQKMHLDSNEKMIKDTGLLWYAKNQHIQFYPVIKEEMGDPEQAANDYDETVRHLLNHSPKSIGILGVGLDGHTAGLPAGRQELQENEKTKFVTAFHDFPGPQKERVSMTFLGLSLLDLLIILVFGEDKKEALQQMFSEGEIAEIPARFFKVPDIAKKTLLITDQEI